ncbi:hypothetical protein [Brevundimonas sp. Root1423]|uniref:hypothetical protein n=1 Tax=Brevundimonas sp. Root1423 TaxID=1736462 RepID=UPI0006F32DF6|nr:hypothetical protein [Brevundimonas sp. Root1423]KQY89565.1 hypothetical protein ASD25_03025 [Brevundimonas sp. Root1423]
MTMMFNEPTMQWANPYFRLWQFIQDCGVRHPDTDQCAKFMGMDRGEVRWMLRRLSDEGYVVGDIQHSYGRRSRGRACSTWYCRDWTSAMINRPFPKPRHWKPPFDSTYSVDDGPQSV